MLEARRRRSFPRTRWCCPRSKREDLETEHWFSSGEGFGALGRSSLGGPMGAAKAQGSEIRVTGKTVRLDSSLEEGALKGARGWAPLEKMGVRRHPRAAARVGRCKMGVRAHSLGDRECRGTEDVGTVVAVTFFSSRSGWGPGRSVRQVWSRNSLQGAPREVAGGWAGGVSTEGARASLPGACVSVQEEAGHSRGGRWRWARRVETRRWGLPGARERELSGV